MIILLFYNNKNPLTAEYPIFNIKKGRINKK